MSTSDTTISRQPFSAHGGSKFLLLLALTWWSAAYVTIAVPATAPSEVQLFSLDCGRATLKDMGGFSDTDDYNGKPGEIAVPCFLIRHPHGTLLWDAGLGDKYLQHPQGVAREDMRLYVDQSIGQQLALLGLSAADIQYLAFSHFHFDHTGNANLFTNSTWIINRLELAAALSATAPPGVDKSLISSYSNVKTQMINFDHDVFGDGTVRILQMPGHTPGHQVLLVKLAKAGFVALSGDLYHLRDNRRFRRVPLGNTSRADTLASMDRFEHLVETHHARVIVQHDPEDFRTFPKFPAYLN